jgi:tRNA pseudouridine(55) synthase
MRPIVADPTNGLVLLDKEPGRTSFQALYPVKRIYGNSVGHTGTLDQFAEGLLVVLVGKFTKFNPLFTAFDKVYEADFTFGAETSTLDPEGEVVFSGPVPSESPGGLASRWTGPQMQVPPEYSAIHIDGRRASDRVRDGQSIQMPSRPITVYSLDVLGWTAPVLTVRIHCSKGTYVRSIARDWGRAVGCGAHVTRLRRTRVGPFALPPSGPLEFKEARWGLDVLGIPVVTAEADEVSFVLNGRDPARFVSAVTGVEGPRAAIEGPGGVLLAVIERDVGPWKYLFVDRGLER